MQLKIAKIIEAIDLGEYAEAMKGQTVQVWVNPDLATLRRRELLIEKYNRLTSAMLELGQKAANAPEAGRAKLARETKAQIEEFNSYALGDFASGINAWFAELWSQSPDPSTHWTVEELAGLNEADPAFYQWLKNRSVEMLAQHRNRQKKG